MDSWNALAVKPVEAKVRCIDVSVEPEGSSRRNARDNREMRSRGYTLSAGDLVDNH